MNRSRASVNRLGGGLGWRLFALALIVYVFTAGGSLTTTDAVATFDVTRSIVEHGSVAMSGNLLGQENERGVDGRYYSPFGIGQSVYNIPFYVTARGLASAGIRIGKPDSMAKALVALGQTIVVAAVVRECFLLAAVVAGDVASAALAALTLAFASILWPYSRFGFNQPLACLTLLAATRQTWIGAHAGTGRSLGLAGVWLAASFLTRHEMILAAIPLIGWLWFDGRLPLEGRLRRLAAIAPGLVSGMGVWMTYNVIRFGHPFNAGQDAGPAFGSPLVDGLLGLLASPAASVFLYSPFALAGVVGLWVLGKRDRSAAVLLATLVVVFLAFYANLGNWLAGRSYGSRYLVVVLPYLCVGWAAALSAWSARRRRVGWALVGALGLALQVPGVLVDYAKVSQAVGAERVAYTTEQRQWDWHAAPLVLNTRALARAVPENIDYLLGRRPPPLVTAPSSGADRTFSQQFAFSLDLWWLYLFYLHVLPAWGVGLLVVGFGAAIAVAGRRVMRDLRHTEHSAWTWLT